MEEAALKSYASDICRGGDITTQSFNAVLKNADASGGISRPVDPMLPPIDVFEEREESQRGKNNCYNSIP